jgi:hypothetical protein
MKYLGPSADQTMLLPLLKKRYQTIRILRLPITIVALALAIAGLVTFRASAQSPLTSIIVELKDSRNASQLGINVTHRF